MRSVLVAASRSGSSLHLGLLCLCGAAGLSLGSLGLARRGLSPALDASSLADDESQRSKTTGSESGQVGGAGVLFDLDGAGILNVSVISQLF